MQESRTYDLDQIVKSAQDGDEHAVEKLITIHKALVFTIIMRIVNDREASQDLTQETFIKAFRNIKKVKNGSHFKPWLCRIAKNCVYDYLRKRKRQKTISLQEVKEIKGESGLERIHRSIIIQDALNRLRTRDRMLLVLTYYKGFSNRDVARALKLSPKSIKVYLHRARARLRRELKGYENELLSIQQ